MPSAPHLASLALLCAGILPLACGGARKKQEVAAVELAEQLPILPARNAEVYARGHSVPADPVVAVVASELPWDEALSGAAASLALDAEGPISLPQAQWMAWRAGYPFPVAVGAVGIATGLQPPQAVRSLVEERLQEGEDLGLARARAGQEDRWVALIGRPIEGVPVFDRQHAVGEALEVALPAQARWIVVSPEGLPRQGAGPVHVILDELGEWWLDATLPAGRLSLPVYAGMDMPPTPVVELPGLPSDSPTAARDELYRLLDRVRADFELAELSPDPLLETLAVAPLEALDAGAWVQEEEVQRLRAAGFVGGTADQVWCEARTVALCLEGLMRTAQGRVAVLEPGHRLVGAWARVSTDGTLLVLNLASDG